MNKFAAMSGEELNKHLEGFLIDHWSVSSVGEFIRNEKSFERKYVFKDYDRQKSKSAHIGNVYDHALTEFFRYYQQEGKGLSYDVLLRIAHLKLEEIGADEWKNEKKLTILEQQQYALEAVNFALKSFLEEFSSYENEIGEILWVNVAFKEFITINGQDIPVPFKFKPDMVFITKDGYLAVLDHKAKYNYTEEKNIISHYCNQSIGYVLGMNVAIHRFKDILKKYPKAAEGVKKFFFYENKFTKNKDGSSQIKQIPMDIEKHGQLLEQILFEGVFRVMEAVQNPNYVYLMNPNDHFESGEKVVAFWIKTHVEGLEGFPNLTPGQIKILKQRRSSIRRSALTSLPKGILKAFTDPKEFVSLNSEEMENLSTAEKIEHRLRTFNYPVKVEHTVEGYSCDTYLLQIAAGLKTAQIYGYRMDIANVIGVKDVRISPSLVEYKGGAYVAVEVNRKNTKALVLTDADMPFEENTFPIGKDNFGHSIMWSIDNPSTPHMMISGASGSGKSVAIKTIIEVALKAGIRVALLDPKYEFTAYKAKGCEVLNELTDIEQFMEYTVLEMDEIFKKHGAHGHSKNKRLIILDEAADCFARQTKQRVYYTEGPRGGEIKTVDHTFKTLEENTLILAQKARSAGIHLVLAAQRFSVKVLTGDAKANFSTRLCLTVASGVDSKVMLDREGAEKLNGKGDALLTSPEHSEPVRIQCFTTQS